MTEQSTKAIATASQASRYLHLLLDGQREEIKSQYIRPFIVYGNPYKLPYSFRRYCGAIGGRDIEDIGHKPGCRYVARLAMVDAVEAWLDSLGPHPDDVDLLEDDWMRDPSEGDR